MTLEVAEDELSAWVELLRDPLLSLSRLKNAALAKEGLGEAASDGGVLLRSVYWRFYHGLLPTPTSLDLFPPALETARAAYASLRRRYLIAPDGRWAADCSGGDDQPEAGPSRTPTSTNDGDGWDPLSLDGGSPWKTWFVHQELRATIRQDVERTFPDIPYFRIERVRTALVTALFLFSVLNPDVGYRQGMHELLAVCVLAVDRDSLVPQHVPPSIDKHVREAMIATLDRRYIEHDAFGLFQEIMRSAKAFYEWRAEEGPKSRLPHAPKAPIITRCNHIHSALIRRIDPQLWERFETEGLEAQIWAIRWLRLILTRELPFPLALRLWDGLFAEDPGFGLLDFICVAMLLLIRNERGSERVFQLTAVLEADYPGLLTSLLHYPVPSTAYSFSPHLILSQAMHLRGNISPSGGVEVVIQNEDLLGVRAAPPDPVERPQRGRGDPPRGGTMRGRGGPPRGVQSLAQGLFERAQAAGLDKAILSTVADLRKNLPDSATAYSYLPNLPFSPTQSPGGRDGHFSTIPSNSAVLPPRSFFSPPPSDIRRPDRTCASTDSNASIRSIKDAERELAELRLAMMGMGKAMNEWLLALNAPESSDLDRMMASRGLERVRDTLLDAAGREVDDVVKEWGWHEGLEARSQAPTPVPPPPIEPPAETFFPPPAETTNPRPGSDSTPTGPEVDVLPPTPKTSSFPTSFSSATRASQPSLLLSTRGSQPMSGLPRVPLSAPAQSSRSSWSAGSPVRASAPPASLDGKRAQAESATKATSQRADSTSRENSQSKEADPLAGIGVAARAQHEKAGLAASARMNGDPLGAA